MVHGNDCLCSRRFKFKILQIYCKIVNITEYYDLSEAQLKTKVMLLKGSDNTSSTSVKLLNQRFAI